MTIEESIDRIGSEASVDLSGAHTSSDLESIKIKYLGKKGAVGALMKELRTSSGDERARLGRLINDLKEELVSRIAALFREFEDAELSVRLESESLDVTLPGRRRVHGRPHILTQVLDEATDILSGMGFSVQYGPDVESEFYNFEALNFTKDHPARDMQDTFYISPEVLLRTHTSNTQVRTMEGSNPPIRIIAPGRCYRNEDVTARSHVVFHQIEGLYIDKGVNFSDLLGTLKGFFATFFGCEIRMRYRPSYFPFVEPGMEVDIHCLMCDGAGCGLCKHTGWLEVAGAGMVHPEVLKSGGIDPEEYSGYAWGFGIERLAQLRHSIFDIRLYFTNDMRFLRQF